MARRRTTRWDPRSRTYVRRLPRRRRSRGVLSYSLGELGTFGRAKSIAGTLKGLKGVFFTGAIAAGGAIITERLFRKIQEHVELDGYVAILVKMGSGVILGIIIAKVLKKPAIGAAFAIGPIVSGVIDVVNMVTSGESAATAGMYGANPLSLITAEKLPEYAMRGIGASEVSTRQSDPFPEYLLNVDTAVGF